MADASKGGEGQLEECNRSCSSEDVAMNFDGYRQVEEGGSNMFADTSGGEQKTARENGHSGKAGREAVTEDVMGKGGEAEGGRG